MGSGIAVIGAGIFRWGVDGARVAD